MANVESGCEVVKVAVNVDKKITVTFGIALHHRGVDIFVWNKTRFGNEKSFLVLNKLDKFLSVVADVTTLFIVVAQTEVEEDATVA